MKRVLGSLDGDCGHLGKKDLTVMVSESVDVSLALSDGVIKLAILEALHVSL